MIICQMTVRADCVIKGYLQDFCGLALQFSYFTGRATDFKFTGSKPT